MLILQPLTTAGGELDDLSHDLGELHDLDHDLTWVWIHFSHFTSMLLLLLL